MKTIWKYPLKVVDQQTIRMPERAQILSVQTQNGTPCIWALVQPDAVLLPRTINTFGTGHPIDGNPGAFVGTYQLQGGALVLVFHVFEA